MHWSDFVKKRIFEPAGMTTAQVITEVGIVANRAAGYERGEDGGLRNQEWVSPTLNRLADDDVAGRRMKRRGENIVRIAYYALETADARFRYRFYLTTDDRVAAFAVDKVT